MQLLYKPFPSKRKNKKYSVYVMSSSGKPKLIHFGQLPYQHFRDKLGTYRSLDHGNSQRRAMWYARHKPTKDKNTARYWAARILW